MRRRSFIVWLVVLLAVAAVFIYIRASSTVINQDYYRNAAWELSNHDKTIIDWETAPVTVVNVKGYHVARTSSSRINDFLLFLNGEYAVKVEFRTTQDGQLGPIVLYFNPFTKQCIGGALRM